MRKLLDGRSLNTGLTSKILIYKKGILVSTSTNLLIKGKSRKNINAIIITTENGLTSLILISEMIKSILAHESGLPLKKHRNCTIKLPLAAVPSGLLVLTLMLNLECASELLIISAFQYSYFLVATS